MNTNAADGCSGETACYPSSTRLTWQELWHHRGKKYRGIDPRDGKRKTLTFRDVQLGGDVVIYRRSWGEEIWKQERFLLFLSRSTRVDG